MLEEPVAQISKSYRNQIFNDLCEKLSLDPNYVLSIHVERFEQIRATRMLGESYSRDGQRVLIVYDIPERDE